VSNKEILFVVGLNDNQPPNQNLRTTTHQLHRISQYMNDSISNSYLLLLLFSHGFNFLVINDSVGAVRCGVVGGFVKEVL
jgi:hypothetical protein